MESDADLARWRTALDSSGIQLIIVLDEPVAIRDSRIISWQSVLQRRPNSRASSADRCELRWRTIRPEDPLTVIFTSGTTGPPKGVVLTHENILYEVHAIVAANGLDDPGTAISYLPFAHIAERILSMYLPQSHGGHVRFDRRRGGGRHDVARSSSYPILWRAADLGKDPGVTEPDD